MMTTFSLCLDGPVAAIRYERETENFADELLVLLRDAKHAGASGVFLDKRDDIRSYYSDELSAGRQIGIQLANLGIKLAAVLHDDDYQTRIALAVAVHEGARVLISTSENEARDWLRGYIS